jgi:drug/metabolite transporter, DME family
MLRSRLYLLAAAVFWSTGGAAVKLSNLSGWQLASGRSLIAALVLALAIPASRRRLSWRGLASAVAYAATVVLFMLANKLTTSANAIFLQDTAPLYVLLLSPLLLRERPSRGELAAAPLFLLGLSLFFLDQLHPGQMLGNVMALGSGLAFAVCILGLRAVGAEGSAVLVWGNLLAGVCVLWPALGGPSPRLLDLGLLLFLGTFQLGLAYALFQRGLQAAWDLGHGRRRHHPAGHRVAHAAECLERPRHPVERHSRTRRGTRLKEPIAVDPIAG